ncbi:MAG: hypothetical protein COZ36_01045 [Piscirickettsiaceae bacterium CG_4_10_14_3_um_filter_44_349]|nr:MAG: hypothetical protein COW74_00750 [Piscirickettsiaceae bacterium CG18_big_fil_WC_8_21_14_2_50_44_103]PIX80822.1 MAG: hypothetical protein COZ36_01045 [Piscirickettsiaceae bacterium CG_4_10_14_3_um_filter_44_349]PIY76685.1 MAG: hypothetical protein COY84_04725 [Piscirickettsiaceae bacterium CG_4_10_14_0_8_um_filter_44_742]
MTENNKNEKFIRWQGVAITQLSYSINLILTFSVAALGFGVSLLVSEKFNPTICQAYAYFGSLFLLLVSGAFGIWCTINRLRDFRATAKICNLKRKDEDNSELPELRELTNKLGRKTWGIFWWQIGTFSAGILILVLFVAFSSGKAHL